MDLLKSGGAKIVKIVVTRTQKEISADELRLLSADEH